MIFQWRRNDGGGGDLGFWDLEIKVRNPSRNNEAE
jgi:hypothetical protein